jgi:hypothetical protein
LKDHSAFILRVRTFKNFKSKGLKFSHSGVCKIPFLWDVVL